MTTSRPHGSVRCSVVRCGDASSVNVIGSGHRLSLAAERERELVELAARLAGDDDEARGRVLGPEALGEQLAELGLDVDVGGLRPRRPATTSVHSPRGASSAYRAASSAERAAHVLLVELRQLAAERWRGGRRRARPRDPRAWRRRDRAPRRRSASRSRRAACRTAPGARPVSRGGKPRNVNRSVGRPDRDQRGERGGRARDDLDARAGGDGGGDRRVPGSLMPGMPASLITATFLPAGERARPARRRARPRCPRRTRGRGALG